MSYVQLMLSHLGKWNLTNDSNYFLKETWLMCNFQPLIQSVCNVLLICVSLNIIQYDSNHTHLYYILNINHHIIIKYVLI